MEKSFGFFLLFVSRHEQRWPYGDVMAHCCKIWPKNTSVLLNAVDFS